MVRNYAVALFDSSMGGFFAMLPQAQSANCVSPVMYRRDAQHQEARNVAAYTP
jgi:hypothetical protein